MFGSKTLKPKEIENTKYGRNAGIDYAIHRNELYISKKTIYEAADKPEIAKAKINKFIREHTGTSITVQRLVAKKASDYEFNFKKLFDRLENKTAQVTFVKPQSLVDALATSKDANRDIMIRGVKNYARFINHNESENKHIIAEHQAAARIKELSQANESYRNKLEAAKRDLDEIVVENVKLHNQLEIYNMVKQNSKPENAIASKHQQAEPIKRTFFERLKALFS